MTTVTFTHTVEHGETLSGIVQRELHIGSITVAEKLALKAAKSAGILIFNINEWSRRFATTPTAICGQIKRQASRFVHPEKTPFVDIRPGQTISGTYDNESGQFSISIAEAPAKNTSAAERDALWNQNRTDLNCYAYAVSGRNPVPRKSLPTIPGVVGGRAAPKNNYYEIREALIRDGLIPADETTSGIPPAREGYYLIFAVVDDRNTARSYGADDYISKGDFHFYRMDDDGSWSQKSGPHPISRVDASGNPLANPMDANKDYRSVLFGGLRFDRFYNMPIGFFYVPNSGIDMVIPPH